MGNDVAEAYDRPRDHLDVYIEMLHRALGHDRAAAYLGCDPGDRRLCRLCAPNASGERVSSG